MRLLSHELDRLEQLRLKRINAKFGDGAALTDAERVELISLWDRWLWYEHKQHEAARNRGMNVDRWGRIRIVRRPHGRVERSPRSRRTRTRTAARAAADREPEPPGVAPKGRVSLVRGGP